MFTVMSWNVENLFTTDPAERADFEAKLDALASVIAAAAPDAVALQEVGDDAALEALRTRLGANWTSVVSSQYEARHPIRVAWLSPRPLTDVAEVVDLPMRLSPVKVGDDGTAITQLGRGALAVTCTTDAGTEVRAITAHLKSKLLSFPPAAGSTPPMRASGSATASTPSTAERPRPPPCVNGPPRRWPVSGSNSRSWSAATSTTPSTPPPPNCSSAHPGPSTAPAATTGPTAVTASGCGPPGTGCPRRTTGPASTRDGAS
jgi:hypothetical protein